MRLNLAFALSLLLIPLRVTVGSPVLPTDCSDAATTKKDVMVTSVFVDTYGLDITQSAVVATSDGGAVFAFRRTEKYSPRVVKVDSEGRFEWYSEHRVTLGDSTSARYFPYAAVQDPDGASVYVAGYSTILSSYTGFIIKYRMTDGSCLGSNTIVLESNTKIFALLIDSAGDLVFGGYCYRSTDSTIYASVGIINKSALTVASGTLASVPLKNVYIYKLIEDPAGSYVYAGRATQDNSLRLGRLSKSAWTQTWDFSTTIVCSAVGTLILSGSGAYSVLCDSTYYVVTSPTSVSAGVTLAGSSTVVSLQEPGMTMVLGSDSSRYSFAYYFNTGTTCVYKQGETAKHYPFMFLAASRHPSYNYVWTAGYSVLSEFYGFVAKVQQVTPLSCTGAQFSYLNKGCYDTTAANCYYLCSSCMISNDMNACYTPDSAAHQSLTQMYAGRCIDSGTHYDSTMGACWPISQSSDCHKLCGGECVAVSDNTRCAHHCISHKLEPNLDDSRLYQNTCRCKLGTEYNGVSGKCETVTGCHASCGSEGCVAPGDSAKCVDCAVGTTKNYIAGAEYVACCGANTIYTSGVCASCHMYCSGCLVQNNRNQCNACSTSIANLQGTGGSPVTCSCISGTFYDTASGNCVYTSGCHSLCLNGKCTVQSSNAACTGCVSSATATLVSPGVYQCTCPSGTLNDNTHCLPILTSGCDPLCASGCIVANDPLQCVDCIVGSNKHIISSKPYVGCCPLNTVYTWSACVACHVYCNGCGVPALNNYCLDCKSLPNMAKSAGSPYKCECITGTQYDSVAKACIYISGCHPLCLSGKCVAMGDSAACLACDPTAASTLVSAGVYSCTCPAGTTYYGATCLTIFHANCNLLCDSAGCIAPLDQYKCLSCVAGASTHIVPGSLSVCCARNTIYVGGACNPCHKLCDGCSLPNDGAACLDCKSGSNIAKTAGSPDFTCACSSTTAYDPDSSQCVYHSRCHPLCAGMCTVQGDQSACVSACVSGAGSRSTAVAGVISCTCDVGSVFNGAVCVPTFQSGCHPLCGPSGCTALNDPTKCLDCSVQPNVVSSSTGTGTIVTRDCGCAAGTHYIPEKSICAYSSDCSPHCDLCFSPHNASACVGCAKSINPVFGLDQTLVICECPAGTIYHNELCAPVMNETCHPLCGPAGCIESGSQAMCVSSCSSSAVSTAESGDIVSCVCAKGTRLNSRAGCVLDVACDPLCANCLDRDTCSACPQEGEGMVLSDGKCICAVSEGYIMVQDQGAYSCMQKTTTASTVAQYTGYVLPRLFIAQNRSTVVTAIMASAVVFPGGGCNLLLTLLIMVASLWKYMSLAQELLLLSVINIRFVSPDLISIFQGGSFANFNLLSPVMSLLPAEYRGEVGYNALQDSSQYHPYIFPVLCVCPKPISSRIFLS